MRKKTTKDKREASPFGPVKLGPKVPDFLPPPEEIARMLRARKVTITLTENCVEFFKQQSEKYSVPYQAMMREVLLNYVRNAKPR